MVGCVVGLVTPALFVSIGAALLYYRKKATQEDRTGQEWDVDEGDADADADGDGVMAYDDNDPMNMNANLMNIDKSRNSFHGPGGANVTNAINF